MRKIITILIIHICSFNIYGQSKFYTIKDYEYVDDKNNLTINFQVPVFAIENVSANKKINDSINHYIGYWKKEAATRIIYLKSIGINKTDYEVNITIDTITINGKNIFLLFDCSDINFSMAKYTFWYNPMAFSLLDGKDVTYEFKKIINSENNNKLLFNYIISQIVNDECKPRIEYKINCVIPLNDTWYYIPYSIEYAKDLYDCMNNNTNILKIFISKDELDNILK